MVADFTVALEDLGFIANGLRRPECVLATARGTLYASDSRGGVQEIRADGSQHLIGNMPDVLPNGIALMPDGSFVIANLHGSGGVWKLQRSGAFELLLTEVDGVELVAVNFVRLDSLGRIWICANPRVGTDDRYATEKRGGFIALLDNSGARIVADEIGWANECILSQSGGQLFLNETFGRKLTAFDIKSDGSLSNRRVVTEFGHGVFPDGLSLDVEGALWVVSIASNRLIRVTPDGRQHIVLRDEDRQHLDELEEAYRTHSVTRTHLTAKKGGAILKNITSLAFGGPDLRTAYLGSIGGERIITFRSPVAGVRPVHWDW